MPLGLGPPNAHGEALFFSNPLYGGRAGSHKGELWVTLSLCEERSPSLSLSLSLYPSSLSLSLSLHGGGCGRCIHGGRVGSDNGLS